MKPCFNSAALKHFLGSGLKCFAESGPRRSCCSEVILNCIHVLFPFGFQQRVGAKASCSAMPRTRKSQIFCWCSSSGLGLRTFIIPWQRSTRAPATPGLGMDGVIEKRYLVICSGKKKSSKTFYHEHFFKAFCGNKNN